jgi:plastocyanin
MTRPIPRRGLAVAGFVVLFATGAALGAQSKSVAISNFAFDPPSLTVERGTRVVWTNRDEEPHTVTSANANAPFKSPGLDTDETFSYVFDKPGTYKYFCTIHPHMVGQVIVK